MIVGVSMPLLVPCNRAILMQASLASAPELEKKAKGDRVQMVRADGKKLKLKGLDMVDAGSEAMNGPGISEARIDLDGYDGAKIDLESEAAGVFQFWNGGERPLYKGFTMGWQPDPEKDPEGKARFTLIYK